MRVKAQSAIEYAVLIGVIVISVVGMITYFQRAINARVENVRQDLNKRMK
jgi:Flp pilus assembly pilin Flp